MSYLVHGQSRQIIETEQAREQFLASSVRPFEPDESVGVGALIELEDNGERLWYFLGPAAGGAEVMSENCEVLVITPQAPLGRLSMGKRKGEQIEMGGTFYQVLSVI